MPAKLTANKILAHIFMAASPLPPAAGHSWESLHRVVRLIVLPACGETKVSTILYPCLSSRSPPIASAAEVVLALPESRLEPPVFQRLRESPVVYIPRSAFRRQDAAFSTHPPRPARCPGIFPSPSRPPNNHSP